MLKIIVPVVDNSVTHYFYVFAGYDCPACVLMLRGHRKDDIARTDSLGQGGS